MFFFSSQSITNESLIKKRFPEKITSHFKNRRKNKVGDEMGMGGLSKFQEEFP